MKKLLSLPIAALLALAAAAPVNAAIIDDLGNNPNSATGAFNNSVLGTTFTDQYTFHLINFESFITFASATNDFTQTTDFITAFTGQLFNSGANGLPGGGDDTAVGPLVPAIACPTNPLGCQVLAGSAILAAGDYYLQIAGIGGGTSGYGGNLTTAPVAVPFPVAGAGLPGLVAFGMLALGWYRRRRAQV